MLNKEDLKKQVIDVIKQMVVDMAKIKAACITLEINIEENPWLCDEIEKDPEGKRAIQELEEMIGLCNTTGEDL